MHFSGHLFFTLGIATSAYLLLTLGIATSTYAVPAATNSVFYAAFDSEAGKSGGCTGLKIGTVQASGNGESACKNVGDGACVELNGHQGDATKCKVFTYSDGHCLEDEDSTIFGKNGDHQNENFVSFKAKCGTSA